MTLAEPVLSGDRRALSRLLTEVENGTPAGQQALDQLFTHTGRAHLVGITGAPGTGKSSLANHLARYYRQGYEGRPAPQVAIIAIDPSSPFTGGAILGDRIRMRDLAGDAGVFIRSMASRGTLGGLAAATAAATQVFDAAGFELILVETVGAGQGEVDIARLAHTTLVVEAPGMGDEIQAIKAGILEIADILVINKADRPGVENTERALKSMLEFSHPARRTLRHHGQLESGPAAIESDQDQVASAWLPPILRTVALEGTGVPELAAAIQRHRDFLIMSGEWKRREDYRLQSELDLILREALVSRWQAGLPDGRYQEVLASVFDRRISPQRAVLIFLQGESQ